MPSRGKLLEVIALQNEVAGLRLDLALGSLLVLVAARAQRLVDAVGAAIEMTEADEMVCRATAGISDGSLGQRLSRSHSLSGLCIAEGRPLYCDDAWTDPRVDASFCRRHGQRSMLVVPLRHHGVVVGVLKATSRRPGHFDQQHLTLLGMVSDMIAAALYFATRYAPGELFH